MKNPWKLRYLLKNSNAPEYLFSEANAHLEVNKDQDIEATYDIQGPKDLNANAIFIPEVPEDHEVPVAVDRDEGNTDWFGMC